MDRVARRLVAGAGGTEPLQAPRIAWIDGSASALHRAVSDFTLGAGGTLTPNTLGNRDLRPEINTETEVGADLELFGRIGLNVSYAKAIIDGQILPVKPPTASGFQFQWQNAGEITNQTWEATLNVPVIQRRNFNWSSRIIWDQTRSVITRLDVPEYIGTVVAGNEYPLFKFRQGERIGTMYGTDYVKNCGQLPTSYASQCSMTKNDASAAYRPNSEGYIVWLGTGNQETEGITKNLWTAQTGLGNGPWGNNTNWGMPITLRDSTSNVAFVPIGNGMPKYHWGMSHNVEFGRFSMYGLLDASMGAKLWNIAYHWSLGDLLSGGSIRLASQWKKRSRSATSGVADRRFHLAATPVSAGSTMHSARAPTRSKMRAM